MSIQINYTKPSIEHVLKDIEKGTWFYGKVGHDIKPNLYLKTFECIVCPTLPTHVWKEPYTPVLIFEKVDPVLTYGLPEFHLPKGAKVSASDIPVGTWFTGTIGYYGKGILLAKFTEVLLSFNPPWCTWSNMKTKIVVDEFFNVTLDCKPCKP